MQQQPYPLGRFHTERQQLEPHFAAALAASALFQRPPVQWNVVAEPEMRAHLGL